MICSYCSLSEAHSGATRSTLPLLSETDKGLRVKCPERPLRWSSQGALVVKAVSANAGDIRDMGLIPRSGRSPGGGHDGPLQYSCLENPRDRGAWWASVRRVAKRQTRLKRLGRCARTTLKQQWLEHEDPESLPQQGPALSYRLHSRAPPWDENEPGLSLKLFPCLTSPSVQSCLPHFLTTSPGIPS